MQSVKVKGSAFGVVMKAPPHFYGGGSQRLSSICVTAHNFLRDKVCFPHSERRNKYKSNTITI